MRLRQDTKVLLKKLEFVNKELESKRLRNRVLGPGARIVRDAAKKKVVKRKKSKKRPDKNPRYSDGKVVALYRRGNLRGSIQVLRKLKKAQRIYIGPGITGRDTKGEFGPGAGKFDGYYAAAFAGSAKIFGATIMQPALEQNIGKVFAIVKNKVKKEELPRIKRKLGIN